MKTLAPPGCIAVSQTEPLFLSITPLTYIVLMKAKDSLKFGIEISFRTRIGLITLFNKGSVYETAMHPGGAKVFKGQ